MGDRLDLQNILEATLGSQNVYFQPPPNVKMQYPCIVYARSDADSKFADNSLYRYTTQYLVTVIDRNPDSAIPNAVARLPLCRYSRFFTGDNLNHDVFVLYY